MAHKSFSYKGYDIYVAAFQPSKRARGGKMRSLQIRKNGVIKKQIRYDTTNVYAFGEASKKCVKWVDDKTQYSGA